MADEELINTEERLAALKQLIVVLDAVRDRRYVSPSVIEDSMRAARLDLPLSRMPEWESFLAGLRLRGNRFAPLIPALERARSLEMPLATLYALGLGLLWMGHVPNSGQISALISAGFWLVVGSIRVTYFVVVQNPARHALTHFAPDGAALLRWVSEAIEASIRELNLALLETGRSPARHRLHLVGGSYAGLDYPPRFRRMAVERYQVRPYPLHPVLRESGGVVKVFMPYLDDKLLDHLSAVPKRTEIRLLTPRVSSTNAILESALARLKRQAGRGVRHRAVVRTWDQRLAVLNKGSVWRQVSDADPISAEAGFISIRDRIEKRSIEDAFDSAWDEASNEV
jgi:hypothetical protein